MIEAVIFDMDGLLIDSEPFWQKTEKELFGELGVNVTPELHKKTFGYRIEEQIEFWYKIQPWENKNFDELKEKYQDIIMDFFQNKAKLINGAKYILDFFEKKKQKKALASSSDMVLIEAFLERFHLKEYFDVVHSAEYEGYGKPHPGVFISTEKKLKVRPVDCLVFEDSTAVVLAAKAVKMKTIAVPPYNHINKNDPIYEISDLKINSLTEFNEKSFDAFFS